MGVFGTIIEGYKVMGQEAKQRTIDNRANIFTGASVVGTIATGIISAFAGAKSARQIDAAAVIKGEPLTLKEKAKLCWKNFIAPVATTGGSIAGAIGSNRILTSDVSRLTQDAVMATKAYNELKKAQQEVLDEKHQQAVKANIAEKEIEKAKEEPKRIESIPDIPGGGVGNSQLFMDSFSGIAFWSTQDKVMLAIKTLQEEMRDTKPREHNSYVTGAIIGVKYTRWLDLIGADKGNKYYKSETSLHSYYGWNKGYHDDYTPGDDDDTISCYLSPGEVSYNGEMRSCYVIEWDQDPSDMRLGDILKREGIG